ncbi:MAG: AI-2E family transporter [Chloroflexi bacterium]|nr:MAG: AI-2E family transporter [Chloroflexota bacterium]
MGYRCWAGAAARPIRGFAGNALLFPLLCPGDWCLRDRVLCILAALPQGWVVTLIVAVYITLLQAIVIGQILSPRIFSKTVGVHPIVALFALFAGGELFGLLGGLLAVPVAGVLQQIIVAIWHRWKNEHPEQFPPEALPVQHSGPLPGQLTTSGDAPTTGVRS